MGPGRGASSVSGAPVPCSRVKVLSAQSHPVSCGVAPLVMTHSTVQVWPSPMEGRPMTSPSLERVLISMPGMPALVTFFSA